MLRRYFAPLLGVCLIGVSAFGEPAVRLSTADSPPFSTDDGTGFYDRVLKEVFSALEMDLEIVHLPSARSLQEVDSGRVDGEFGRIPAVGEAYSKLVMVPEPLAEWHFSAFVLEGTEGPRSFAELGGYHVGFINGWSLYEENVTESRSILHRRHEGLVSAIDQELSLLKSSGRYAELQVQAFGFLP